MSKAGKRVKSGGGQGGPAKWEAGLLAAVFEEDNWKPNVTFVVGNKVEDYSWIKILGETVAAGSRKLFSVLSRETLENEVRELGNPKGKKPKEVPQHYEVTESIKTILDNNEEIPLPLLAKLLKFKLLWIKSNDLKRREQERKAANDKGKEKKGSAKGKDKPKSAGKGAKGGKKTPEPPSAKEGSKLRKRGEEDDTGKYIDDEPDDGANHYILVCGYNNPHLFKEMAELGINVDSVIRIGSQDYERFEKKDDEPAIEKDEKTLALEEEERKQKKKFKKELKTFWKDVILLLQKPPDDSKLHDISRMEYEVKSLIIPENLEDPEQKALFGSAVFEDIACMIYDLIDSRRQYKNYLQNLKLIHVPVFGQPSPPSPGADDGKPVSGAPTPAADKDKGAPPPATSVVPDQDFVTQTDMRYYNDLMNCVPQESVSVPLVMHSMLEQIVATEESKEPPSEQVPPRRKDGLNSELAKYISGMAFKLALTEEEHNILSDVFDLPDRPPEKPSGPLLMNANDKISQNCQNLKTIYGFNPEQVEKEMLERLPFSAMLDLPRPTSEVAKERAARLQELVHFCATGGLSQSEIDRAFKQFVFECMDWSTTDPNGFIMTKEGEGVVHTVIPWDDPYPFFKGMIPHHLKSALRDPMSTPSEERSVRIDPVPRIDSDLIDYSISGTSSDVTPIVSPVPPPPRQHADTKKRPSRSKKKPKRAASPTPLEEMGLVHRKSDVAIQNDRSRPGSSDSGSLASSKKGILRPSSRSSTPEKRRSRSNSVVHFEKDDTGKPVRHVEMETEEVIEPEPYKSPEESMHEIVDAQKRKLDQWCFAEHYEKPTLLQILKEAIYYLPFVDTYYNKRDHSMMVVLHNPHSFELQNHVDWHTELHSNLGLRNYKEYVEESIADWTKEEEAKYQAGLLSQELDKMRNDEEEAAKAEAKAAKRGKSPGKSPSRSKSPKSRSSSQERSSSANSNIFVRNNSLKAWKEEQDRIKAEEDDKERAKSAKRSKSPGKKGDDKDKKRPGSRGSAKSKGSQDKQEPVEFVQPSTPVQEEFWPFTGYDVGNKLIHVSGITTTLFPSDGGQIRTERTDFVQGTSCVKATVLKDGHIFSVHILDPKENSNGSEDEDDTDSKKDEKEKSEYEKSEKDDKSVKDTESVGVKTNMSVKSEDKKTAVSAFGSITAQLMDGMTMSLSQFGESGTCEEAKKYEPKDYVAPPTTPSPAPPPSPAKSKKGDKKGSTPEPPPQVPAPDEGEKIDEEKKDEEKPIVQPFQQLYVTCPDGLNVKYILESSVGMKPMTEDDRRLLVKQSYPFKTRCEQECEAPRKKYIQSEVSRIITSEGTVIKNMVDGNVEVLYADGTISVHTGHWPLPVRSPSPTPRRAGSAMSQPERAETPTKKTSGEIESIPGSAAGKPAKGGKPVPEKAEEEPPEQEKKGVWTTTYPSGEKIQYKENVETEDLKPVMICVATDPETNQTMATRDDHVMTISYPDGTTIVEHADGTRITTYYRENQITRSGEESYEGEEKEIEVQTIKFVKVECPAYATVEFNSVTSENLTIFGNGTTINVFPDGYYMLHHYDSGRLEVDTEGTVTYYPRPNKITEQMLPERDLQYVLRHNADIVIESVDLEGNVFNVKSNGDYAVMTANEDDLSDTSQDESRADKRMASFKEHAPRFFICHADGSGTELMRYQDVAEYINNAEQSQATAVLRDDLPDYPGVQGITILKPYVGGLSDVWFKKYDQESIIPQGIRSRDLTTLPPKEFKTPGPKYGTTLGQGLNVGTVSKQAARIPILKCPNKLELRQIIQYKPVSNQLRDQLQAGLKDYAEYVINRNKTSEFMQPVDPRTDEEKIHAADLQEMGLHSATNPQFPPEVVKDIYEKAMTPPAPSPPPTPTPKRTKADWERDQRELAEEQEGRNALRNKKIPVYFDSEFGKAFLLSQAKDVDEILQQLSEDPRKDGTQAVRGNSFSHSNKDQVSPANSAHPARSLEAVKSGQSDRSSASPGETLTHKPGPGTPMSYSVYPETVPSRGGIRPGNPTPAHAAGQGSPAPIRPDNPTPVHAGKTVGGRPTNPTPKQAGGLDSPSDLPSQVDFPAVIMEHPTLEEGYTQDEIGNGEREAYMIRSLKMDVTGKPRRNPVPVPPKGGKPGAIPNNKFQMVEDPVKRKVKNSLTVGSSVRGQMELNQMKGLILLPQEVDFGVLKEGNTYSYTIHLKNTGVDSGRFKLKQPPPSTGLRVVYKPGPIAAGMKTELNLEIYAIAVGVEGESGVGSISHELEIVTETDVLFLPISATILTAYEFENREPNSPKGGKSPGTKLVSLKPPASSGIIRPRRDQLISGTI
ncbi:sperm-associated antigen 17-like isoform X7 [Mytilus galloprovincialis]|uniref:sperm-associated antigen 17-like isoform X7 n=1 Tax=Mytilus galloprovincialis TaxID=29158 RepID=UPI003F7B970D